MFRIFKGNNSKHEKLMMPVEMAKRARSEMKSLLLDAKDKNWTEVWYALTSTELNFMSKFIKEFTEEEKSRFKEIVNEVQTLFNSAKPSNNVEKDQFPAIKEGLEKIKEIL